jgi:hypothetical protein
MRHVFSPDLGRLGALHGSQNIVLFSQKVLKMLPEQL